MTTYRVYYVDRELGAHLGAPNAFSAYRDLVMAGTKEPVQETEWEEEVDAADIPSALYEFFRQHLKDMSQLMWVDEDGEGHAVVGLDYDPDQRYIWIEDGKLMEYQGLDEATPGMVTCPLCTGRGEVDGDTAERFGEVWGEGEEEDEGADVQG